MLAIATIMIVLPDRSVIFISTKTQEIRSLISGSCYRSLLLTIDKQPFPRSFSVKKAQKTHFMEEFYAFSCKCTRFHEILHEHTFLPLTANTKTIEKKQYRSRPQNHTFHARGPHFLPFRRSKTHGFSNIRTIRCSKTH